MTSHALALAEFRTESVPVRRFLGVAFSGHAPADVVRLVTARLETAPFAYVVTPNADHLVRLSRDPQTYKPLYDAAWLRLLDSRAIDKVGRLLSLQPPPVVTGSDLTEAMVEEAVRSRRPVTIIGMEPAEVQALVERTGLDPAVVAHHNPPMGLDGNPAAFEAALRFVEEHPARFVFLAVGSPRQERLAKCLQERGRATGIGLCIGASLLFLTGAEKRAPMPLRRAGLEWVWRLGMNPRRMWRRYLVDDVAVLRLLWREALARRRDAALSKPGRAAP